MAAKAKTDEEGQGGEQAEATRDARERQQSPGKTNKRGEDYTRTSTSHN
jgi:hypothetical protein